MAKVKCILAEQERGGSGGGSGGGLIPTSLSIITPPKKIIYYAGEIFEADGMIVGVTYDLGFKVETTAYTWEPSGSLKYGTESITILYSSGGKTVSIEQPITVIREEVDIPYQEEHLVYNKNIQQANFNNYDKTKMIIIDGDEEKINAGTYFAKFHFTSERYEWSDTHTIEDRDVEWIIDKFTIQNVPYADDLVYNEKEQSPIWENYDQEQLEIGGQTKGIGAFDQVVIYTSTFTPIQPNYQWEDGDISAKEVQWKIVPSFTATIHVFSPEGSTITCTGPNYSNVITSTGEDDLVVRSVGTYSFTRNKDNKIETRSVEVKEDGETVTLALSWRYGYRKKKAESDPYARIEYLYDAVDMTPAHMDYSEGRFEIGGWGDAWFVRKNRPVMQRSDLTEDYELDHNDHTKRLDNGGKSDVDNASYDGNAMSAIPLCWWRRYEEDGYEYYIVCEHQWDDSYKAYAHTRSDGSIEDYFYWGMFGGSGSGTRIRSLKDQPLALYLTTQNQIDGATANGPGWYIHSWSRRECITHLLVLMAKSTDTQTAYGKGNCHGASSAAGLLTTGTLSDKGQFWGSPSNNQQVKVFYIEGFWGDQWDRTAGIINNSGSIYYKMTPDGDGYRATDVNGYANSGITLTGASGGYISATKCGEFGCIPTAFGGAENLYECDGAWSNTTQLNYLVAGACADNVPGIGGAFTFSVYSAPSASDWNLGCGLSAEMPLPKNEEDNTQ